MQGQLCDFREMGHRPIPQLVWRCLQSADRRPMPADVYDVRAGIARLPVDASTIEKNRESIGKILIWPDGAPIADWRRR